MTHSQMDDATLVALTLSGDPDAYEALVIRYQSAAVGAATRVIGSRYLAEDAAQDAFVTAWMKLDTLCQPEKFGVWVCRISRNCALNLRARFRDYLPDDGMLEELSDDPERSPELLLIRSEENRLLRERVNRLPQKTAEVIRLHYFEGLSVAGIAKRLGISEGTVKWRLHDGRQRLREDLSAMNEKENEPLARKVLKKVEELKAWRDRPDKSGFAAVCGDVLAEVEKLPESSDKYHALADVLVRGFWWIPGKGSDELFAVIREAAEKGRNEDVMRFIIGKEYSKFPHGRERAEFIRNRQIPYLEKLGMTRTLVYAWFWLGYEFHRIGEHEDGFAAYDKVREILTPADAYYAAAISSARQERERREIRKTLDEQSYKFSSGGEIYRMKNGVPCFYDSVGYASNNEMPGAIPFPNIWEHACLCDNRFFFDAKAAGEMITDGKGYTLTFGGKGHTVETPAGRFEDCVLWTTGGNESDEQNDFGRFETYYKPGVGIVRQDHLDGRNQDRRTVYLLSEYHLAGGSGLLPICAGNRWVYVRDTDPAYFQGLSDLEIIHADGETAVTVSFIRMLRYGFDPDN